LLLDRCHALFGKLDAIPLDSELRNQVQ